MLNASDLLKQCGVVVDVPVGSVDEYLSRGPGFMFLHHPALGPMWEVIAQKIRGGRFIDRSELVLEIAEADIEQLTVDGSLLIHAEHPLGQTQRATHSHNNLSQHHANNNVTASHIDENNSIDDTYRPDKGQSGDNLVMFGYRQPRIRLHNVTVSNQGVDWEHPSNVFWEHAVTRKECCRVELQGYSAFTAINVEIDGNKQFIVPDGYHMTITNQTKYSTITSNAQDEAGSDFTLDRKKKNELLIKLEKINIHEDTRIVSETATNDVDNEAGVGLWRWKYSINEEQQIVLEMKDEAYTNINKNNSVEYLSELNDNKNNSTSGENYPQEVNPPQEVLLK